MSKKSVIYRVYTRKGQFHHCYSALLEGALGWAIDCAKVVGGSVKEVTPEGVETEVFSCSKEPHVSAN